MKNIKDSINEYGLNPIWNSVGCYIWKSTSNPVWDDIWNSIWEPLRDSTGKSFELSVKNIIKEKL